jgi:hypothetical protein
MFNKFLFIKSEGKKGFVLRKQNVGCGLGSAVENTVLWVTENNGRFRRISCSIPQVTKYHRENRGVRFFQNSGKFLPGYTASHFKRQSF